MVAAGVADHARGMAELGADTDQLLELGKLFERTSSALTGSESAITGSISAAWWSGDVADGFRSTWRGVHAPALRNAADQILAAGKVVEREALAQIAASVGAAVGSAVAGMFRRTKPEDEMAFQPGEEPQRQTPPDGTNPPPIGSPEQNAEWWASLTPEERRQYIVWYPEIIGNMDGIDLDDRDTANRICVREQNAELQAERDRLEAENADLSGAALLSNLERIQEIDQEIAFNQWLLGETPTGGVDADTDGDPTTVGDGFEPTDPSLSTVPRNDDGSVAPPPTMILGYYADDPGYSGLIVAFGDPETATDTSIFVPGMTSDVNPRSSMENGSDIQQLSGEQPDGTHATIVWMDYNAPDGLGEAYDDLGDDMDDDRTNGPADQATSTLSDFTLGLEAVNPDGERRLIGHSYGSVMVSRAAEDHDMPVDGILLIANPAVRTLPNDWDGDDDWATDAPVLVMINDDDEIAWTPTKGGEKIHPIDLYPHELGHVDGSGGHGLTDYIDADSNATADTRGAVSDFIWGRPITLVEAERWDFEDYAPPEYGPTP